MEIMAPAGDLEILKSAVLAGADAVYFGGQAFNARRTAKNFTPQDIREAAAFARLYGARTAVTINTVVFEDEMREMRTAVRQAIDAGTDIIIAQDLAVLHEVKSWSPDFTVYASTQMSAHSVQDCFALAELGFSQVVAARELSERELEKMCEQSPIPIEAFVHGAQCMSVSGQCYFSSCLGERSANRGLCAQPCRLPYGVDGNRVYALSLKDLSLIRHIRRLQDLGVAAVKIEGRLKGADYVTGVVTAARRALEGQATDERELAALFSRGFSDGYFTSRLGRDMFGTRDEDGSAAAQGPGTLPQTAFEPKRIPVRWSWTLRESEPFLARLSDLDGNCVEIAGEVPSAALTSPLTAVGIAERLARLGGTPFVEAGPDQTNQTEKNSQTDMPFTQPGLFLPASAINEVRRKACEALADLRRSPRQKGAGGAASQERPLAWASRKGEEGQPENAGNASNASYASRPANIAFFENPESLCEAALDFFDEIYLPARIFAQEGTGPERLARRLGAKGGVQLPRVSFGKEGEIAAGLARARSLGIARACAHTLGRIRQALLSGFEVRAGFGANLANGRACRILYGMGVGSAVISPEVSLSRARAMDAPMPLAALIYGHLPLMVARNCPYRAHAGCNKGTGDSSRCEITDRSGRRLALRCSDGACEIFNADPIALFDSLAALGTLDRAFLFGAEDAVQVEGVISDCKSGLMPAVYTRGAAKKKVL